MASTSLKIMWRPTSTTDTRAMVFVGAAVGVLTLGFQATILGKDVVVLLTDLSPLSTYYYTVCSSTVCAPSSADMYFTTSPTYGDDTQSVRVHVLGDPGKGLAAGTTGLAAAATYFGNLDSKPATMWFMNGDECIQ